MGSTYTAILISAAATLQTVQILCASLIQPGYRLDIVFGKQLGATVALVVLTGLFCLLFWLLKIIRSPEKFAAH